MLCCAVPGQHVRSTALWCKVYARAVLAPDAASLSAALSTDEDGAGVSARTPPRHSAAMDGADGGFATPPSSVHPSLQGTGSPAEAPLLHPNAANDDDCDGAVEAFEQRRCGYEPGGGGDDGSSRSVALEFPALDHTPTPHAEAAAAAAAAAAASAASAAAAPAAAAAAVPSRRRQQREAAEEEETAALSPRVATLLESARLGGFETALVGLGVRTQLDLGDVTDDDLSILGLSTLEIRRFGRLRLQVSTMPATAARLCSSSAASEKGGGAADGPSATDDDDLSSQMAAGFGPIASGSGGGGGTLEDDETTAATAVGVAAERDGDDAVAESLAELEQSPEPLCRAAAAAVVDPEAAEAAAAIEAAAAMRARLAAMIGDIEDS